MAYAYISLTILLTVYGQLVLKWQASLLASHGDPGGPHFVLRMLLSPWVITGLAAAFAASICWMLAVARLELSRAYPFMALNFVIVAIAAAPLFGETYTLPKFIGLVFIVIGLFVSSHG